VVKRPPPEDKLLTGLDADFEALLKREKDPAPFRRAALLLNHVKGWASRTTRSTWSGIVDRAP